MKISSLFVLFCMLAVYSCSLKPKTDLNNIIVDSTAVSNKILIKTHPMNYDDSLPNKRFSKSEIISCSFNKEALFGTWTTSHENPACDFVINEKELYLCDYDGDGARFYKIEKDTLFLDNPY